MDQRSGDGRESKSSSTTAGKNFSNFEMLDASIVSAVDKHPRFSLQQEGQSRGTESPERVPVSRGRQIAILIYDYFRVTGEGTELLRS